MMGTSTFGQPAFWQTWANYAVQVGIVVIPGALYYSLGMLFWRRNG